MYRTLLRYVLWFQREIADDEIELAFRRNLRYRKRLLKHAAETKQVLFDSQWMTEEEAKQRFCRLERESKVKIVEISILLTLLFFSALMPFIVLAIVGGIAG